MGHSIHVSTREAAAALRVSVRTVQRWAKTGKLAATKTAGRWVIELDAPSLGDYSPAQIDKAREAIEQGAILRTSRPGMYTAVSSDGVTTYLVAAEKCTCPAARKDRRCYHRLAVAIIAASARRAA